MKLKSTDLPALYEKMTSHVPELEVIAIRDPNQEVPSQFTNPDDNNGVTGARGWAFLANSSPDSAADIEIMVEVIDGPHQGLVSDWLDPDGVDSWLNELTQ